MTTLSLLLACVTAQAFDAPELIPGDPLLEVPVGGLERTDSKAAIASVNSNHGFGKALRVTVGKASDETNATQLTIPIVSSVPEGEVLMASLWVRGTRPSGKPAHIEMLFEKATDPWTKSLVHPIEATNEWKAVAVPFKVVGSYASRQAMLSLRFAFGPQTVELANLSLADCGKNADLNQLVERATAQNPLGTVNVDFDLKRPRQTMLGFGGNFCQPRYGSTEAMDAVGRYNLDHLNVVHARVGLPLNYWTPEPGVYRDEAQAAASLKILAEMARRHIPTVLSIWEGPGWMLGGSPEQSGRLLPAEKYDACIDAVVRYLILAREKYHAKVDYLSFNEPDYGVNFKFTSATMRDFILKAGPRLRVAGLATKFVVGDTANGFSAVRFDTPLLEDKALAPYLGPIAFHCWDVLNASEEAYTEIADLGAKFKKPVWCLEAGHDSELWQAQNPWGTWENALCTALAYERTLRLARPSLMDYWTYQDNYPLVDGKRRQPYPVFYIVRQMQSVFLPGSRVVVPKRSPGDLRTLGTVDAKGRIAVLLVNPVGAGQAVVGGLRPNAAVRVVTSDRRNQNRVLMGKADRVGRFKALLPMRSIATLVSSYAQGK